MLFPLLICSSLQAQVHIQGEVQGIWGESELIYFIDGDTWVPTSYFLTILPGVEVRVTGDYDFDIYGGLDVQGTEADTVLFVYHYFSYPGMWGGLRFENNFPGSTELNYCKIESGVHGVNIVDCTFSINHTLIRQTSLSPVRGDDSDIILSFCTITESTGSGIFLQNTSATISNCDITYHSGYDGHGINASGGGTINISGGYIGHNTGMGIKGITLGIVGLDQLEIAENGWYGVNLTSCAYLTGNRVLVHHNADHGIFVSSTSMDANNLTVSGNAGMGIFCANANLQLSSSIVDENEDTGIYCQSASGYLSYNCVANNSGGNYEGCNPGTGSIEEDPLYVSVPDMDYHLQEESPCIDTGSPSDPQDPDGTVTDMGRHYYDQDPVTPWEDPTVVSGFEIISAYPNPFNPALNIVIHAENPVQGSIEVWNVQGQPVSTIWSGKLMPGINRAVWNADRLPSGAYFIHLNAGDITRIRPCVLLK